MAVSVFELFKIGIGPSSSHTVGPMKAAHTFVQRLNEAGLHDQLARIQTTLYGSLAFTGRGHGTDKAIMMGLSGNLPDQIDPDLIDGILQVIESSGRIRLGQETSIGFVEKSDLLFNKKEMLPHHSNGMRFKAFDQNGILLLERDYYSVGGGFVVNQDEAAADRILKDQTDLPYIYSTGDELLKLCADHDLRISDIMLANEKVWRSETEIRDGLFTIWDAMKSCILRGYANPGVLPGGLKVQRRAPGLYKELNQKQQPGHQDPLKIIDWVNLYALAVNEENAAGGRVVTAPTNGAAGIIPAVLSYYDNFIPDSDDDGIIEFLLTAGAIGILYMLNASISGAEVGCQGEVGVACSMAAGGLTAALGGNMSQVENAAEIGMEHNLGLTCDPVGGLVQIPCIERNAMGSVKAINAQRLAIQGEGKHKVSLDKVIKTMRETGADMKNHYKETSRGGLAVNVIEC
jgi:L-serine dehydratase